MKDVNPPPPRFPVDPGARGWTASCIPIAPVWSPDGTATAYALDGSADVCSIWVMNADGTGLRQVTTGDACDYDASWQPVPRR